MKKLLPLVAFAAMTLSANAVIVSWDFTGAGGQGSDNDAVNGATLLDTSAATVLPGFSVTAIVGDANAGGVLYNPGKESGSDEIALKSWDSGYIEYTINAVSGTFDLAQLTIDTTRFGTKSPTSLRFDVNVDGGGFSQFGTTVTSSDIGGSPAIRTFNGSITGASSAVIRFTATGGDAGGGAALRFNNLTADGSFTPIPEPSSTALLGLGGLALIIRRRK